MAGPGPDRNSLDCLICANNDNEISDDYDSEQFRTTLNEI